MINTTQRQREQAKEVLRSELKHLYRDYYEVIDDIDDGKRAGDARKVKHFTNSAMVLTGKIKAFELVIEAL